MKSSGRFHQDDKFFCFVLSFQLTRLNVEYPMLFKLTNQDNERQTHAGVLEFVADEGKVYLPHWVRILG